MSTTVTAAASPLAIMLDATEGAVRDHVPADRSSAYTEIFFVGRDDEFNKTAR